VRMGKGKFRGRNGGLWIKEMGEGGNEMKEKHSFKCTRHHGGQKSTCINISATS